MPTIQPSPKQSPPRLKQNARRDAGAIHWNYRLLSILFLAVALSISARTFPFQFFPNANEAGESAGLVDSEFHYRSTQAGEIWLVWNVVGGWVQADGKQPPKESLPEGTVLEDGAWHSPMAFSGEDFVVTLRLPAGTQIEYGFWIARAKDGRRTGIMEVDEEQKFHAVLADLASIVIESKDFIRTSRR